MHIPGEVKSTLLKRGKQSKEVLDSLKKTQQQQQQIKDKIAFIAYTCCTHRHNHLYGGPYGDCSLPPIVSLCP